MTRKVLMKDQMCECNLLGESNKCSLFVVYDVSSY